MHFKLFLFYIFRFTLLIVSKVLFLFSYFFAEFITMIDQVFLFLSLILHSSPPKNLFNSQDLQFFFQVKTFPVEMIALIEITHLYLIVKLLFCSLVFP